MTVYSVVSGGVVNAQDVTQFYQLLTGAMTDQPVTIANRIRAAMTGAAVNSGYVGGVSSGPPTSGTFQVGDMAIDTVYGGTWVCTAAGTPGTWTGSMMPIASTVLGAPAATFTFSSIPAKFKSLMVVGLGAVTGTGGPVDCALTVNGDSGANYSSNAVDSNQASLNPTGAFQSAQTAANWAISLPGTTYNANRTGAWAMVIPGYSNTTFRKIGMTDLWMSDGGASFNQRRRYWFWNSTAAITTLLFTCTSGNFATGSYFALYGMP